MKPEACAVEMRDSCSPAGSPPALPRPPLPPASPQLRAAQPGGSGRSDPPPGPGQRGPHGSASRRDLPAGGGGPSAVPEKALVRGAEAQGPGPAEGGWGCGGDAGVREARAGTRCEASALGSGRGCRAQPQRPG